MIKKDIDCVNLDNEKFLFQEKHSAVHTDDFTGEEQIYLDFNFDQNPVVAELAVQSFGVESEKFCQKGDYQNEQSVQQRAFIGAISATKIWAHDVDENHYLQTLQEEGQQLQKIWNEQVKSACHEIQDYFPTIAMELAAAKFEEHDYRPVLSVDGQEVLLDTGAMVSVWPKEHDSSPDPNFSLEAVNKTSIRTYGRKKVMIHIGEKPYSKEVILSDVSRPILGWDFMRQYKLSIIWG